MAIKFRFSVPTPVQAKSSLEKRKNPFLVEYGYHFTDSNNIESIMEKGLVPGIKGDWWYEYQEGCQKKGS